MAQCSKGFAAGWRRTQTWEKTEKEHMHNLTAAALRQAEPATGIVPVPLSARCESDQATLRSSALECEPA
jgi:hypothetical protein